MSSSSLRVAILLAVAVSGCSVLDPVSCTDELAFRGIPASASIGVGQKFTARAEFLTCGGRTILPYEVTWMSQDTTVVRVGATTGEVVALKAGATSVTATRVVDGGAGPRIPVTVTP